MMIGSEKLLPVLAVPAEHHGHPLQLSDVKVVKFLVKSGWTAQTVSEALEESVDTMEKAPSYVITDNDSKMRKAVSLSSYTWHRDVSHTLAMFMERTYKDDPDFLDFNKSIATCKRQNCMKEIAYLQSPTQRTKARFMNLSESVEWADRMLMLYHRLTLQEREVFSFLPRHASFIEEMKNMISCIHYIESQMKHQGLSRDTITVCKRHVCISIMRGNDRMRRVGQQIMDYLAEENRLLKDDEVLNNSSDVIESMFGIYKYIQSQNKMNGVTALVLHLPVRLAFADASVSWNYNVNGRLCRTKIRDINLWRDENLMESQVVRRIRTLKTA